MNETGGVGHVPPGWDQWHVLVGHVLYHQPLSLFSSDMNDPLPLSFKQD